jgi:hypothetical protein
MAALLTNTVCTNDRCLISLQKIKRLASENVIKMSDQQCYYTKYIAKYIRLLLRNYDLGDAHFVLPTKSPILQSDLNKLQITDRDIEKIIETWEASPEYAALRAEREALDAQAAAEMAQESEPESDYGYGSDVDSVVESVVEETSHLREVDTEIRWGVQLNPSDAPVRIPLDVIRRIDTFLLPPDHVLSVDLEEDETIEELRKRPLGFNEYDYLFQGVMPPAGIALGIRVNGGPAFDSLEAYVEAYPEITLQSVQGTPIAGGRRRKTRKTRKRRRTRRY